MAFEIPNTLETAIDALVARYPQKRSASLMVLHALQEHFGWISREAVEWTARKLGLEPINVFELVTFYPMFRQEPGGKFQFKICRTLSCALAGSYGLHRQLCERLGLDPHRHGPQTTPDGKYTVEFVECLATCDKAPVVLVNDTFHERVNSAAAEGLLGQYS